MVMNVFFPHKDYNSLLGGKLTMFKLCNYRIMLAKVSRLIFRLFRLILLSIKPILLLVNFCITIRVAYDYFIVNGLFSYL
jgi:hypothetical protein